MSTTNRRKNVEDNENFKNPIHVATLKGDVQTIEASVKAGCKICQEENGQTPLHLAVIKGKTLVVRKLIHLGANLSKINKDGHAPLHLAVLHNRVSLIGDLININTESDIDIADKNGNTALHLAVSMSNANAVRALLIEGANADLKNTQGNAPIHLAAIRGNLKVIEVLVKYVRKPNILDGYSLRPLHLAVLHNKVDAIRKIGKMKGTRIDYGNAHGDSALHLSIKLRNLQAIEALLELKAGVNARGYMGLASLHLAVMYRNMSAMEILQNLGLANRFRRIPVYVGESRKDMPVFKLLCRSKVNANITSLSGGDSILHSVITTDCVDAVKLLLDLRAKPNVFNRPGGLTPLHVAVCFGNKDIIEILLQHGASTSCVDRTFDFPMHSAVKACSSVGIETLLKYGDDLTENSKSSLTPVDIIMEYVREDNFETAVEMVMDVCEKKGLKRKSPVTPHEILKSAKLIFKFEIWKDFENTRLKNSEYISNIICPLRNYINDCFAEIRLMKSTWLHENFSLFHFVLKGWNNTVPLTWAYTSEVALNHILDVATTKGYPIYRDIIVPKLERSSLLKKVLCLRISSVHNGKTTFLDLDAVPKYLDNHDILNLLLASFDLDPVQNPVSKSSNVKKRKLAKS